MRKVRMAIAAVIVLATWGTAGTAPASAETFPTSAGSYDLSYVTSWDGRTRSYRLHLPTGFAPGDGISRPLVMVMHGGLGTSTSMENATLYSPKADANNFIVVYPQGTGGIGGTWNASSFCCGYALSNNVDDVRFLKDIVARLSANYTINANKVFATGHSNGGVMSWRLACDAGDVFKAFAPNAGDSTYLHGGAACNLGGSTRRILNLHGDADTNMPYNGGGTSGVEQYDREPVETPNPNLYGGQTDLGQWTGYNSCAFTALATETTSGYVKKTFCSTTAGATNQIINYKVIGGTHAWYTTSNSSISSTDLTWDFFNSTSGGGGGPATLFSDGFESGNFTGGGWTTTGSPTVNSAAANAGSYGGRLRSTSSITRIVSTVGRTNITVSYARRTGGLDSGELLYAEWSTNGTTWTNITAATQSTTWTNVSVPLPAGAAGQSGFRIRFRLNADQLIENGDLDTVTVTGT
jgi:polyhydroxybutyrate depolymerase